jgi:hypothetical protein
MVILELGENVSIQTHRDKLDVLRHINKNVSERLERHGVTNRRGDRSRVPVSYSRRPGF